jgi:TolB-like protein/DNA-binding winged helix-turn-helix (wHTH) protein/tetratricopeptide (TPR) repeat protein
MSVSPSSLYGVPSATEGGGSFRFGSFEIDFESERLTGPDGLPVSLPPQPFRLLRYFLSSGGRLVSRDELKRELWGEETFVDFDRGLNFCILQIRTALGDDARQPLYIETVPKRGYRFVASIEPLLRSPEPVAAPPRRHHLAATWLLGVIVAVLALAVAVRMWRNPTPARSRLAVLPIAAVDAETRYMADGLTGEVITALGRIDPQHLGVLARPSVETIKARSTDLRLVASRLGADFLLRGSVRREGRKFRTSFELVRGSDGALLWSESFLRESTEMAAVPSSVGSGVAGALALRPPTAASQRAADPRAFDEYLRGRALWSRPSGAEIRSSLAHYERALQIDPGFAAAAVAQAEAWHLLHMRGEISAVEAAARMRPAVARALTSEPALASAHAANGTLLFWYEWKKSEAEEEFRRALALNPSDAGAQHDYGWALIARGDGARAIAAMRSAQQIDPLSPRANVDVAWALIYTGHYDEAIREAQRTIELDPQFEEVHRCLERAFELSGNHLAALGEVRRRNPHLPPEITRLEPAAAMRRIHELRLEQLRSRLRSGSGSVYAAAAEAAHLGRTEEALQWLEKARAVRSSGIPLATVDPMLASLRGNARFRELTK